MLTKEVFTGTDGIITVTINEKVWNEVSGQFDLLPIPFVDRNSALMLTFGNKSVTNTSGEITFDNEGNVNFKLGLLEGVTKDRAIPATLNVVDDDNQNGLDLIHPARPESSMSLIFK